MLNLDNSEKTVLLLIVGLGIFELGREMREACPPMADMRQCDNDPHLLQHLVDGEAHTGIIVAGAALVASLACGNITPGLILLATYGALVWYNHSVLKAPTTY